MASFFKKALGVFVEFDENQNQNTETPLQQAPQTIARPASVQMSKADADKFEKYFDKLLDQANLPGPDYFEFYKMMETLESHILDENARLSATFAALSIQGLTKQQLIDTANKYKAVIEKDKADFELALQDKLKSEVEQRQIQQKDLEKKIVADSEMIQKLTKEINEAQGQISKLTSEITEAQNKLNTNSSGYKIASQALTNKIDSDIQKIQSTL